MPQLDIATLRLFNQQISVPEFTDANALLKHMGAMQGQDFRSAIWAVGLRLKNANISAVEKAYNSGDILRTHAMRPTWHIVARENLSWLLDLTAPHVFTHTKGRHRNLELTSQILKKCHTILEKELEGSVHLTREEILRVFTQHKLPVAALQLSHILMDAELHKIICSGKLKNNKITYALFHERILKPQKLSHEEAIIELAKIYFTSHGPALMEDFQWWSGLSSGKIKLAAATIEKEFSVRIINDKKYYFSEEVKPLSKGINTHYLLPAYDEFIISYKDRSGLFTDHSYAKAISNNGIFRPVIADNKGRAIGIWSQTTKPNQRLLEFQFFESIDQKISRAIEKEITRYAEFNGIQVTVKL